jgi:hypothetical protein
MVLLGGVKLGPGQNLRDHAHPVFLFQARFLSERLVLLTGIGEENR